MSKKRTTEEFKKVLSERYGDQFELLSEYINNSTKVKLRCNHCGNIIYKRPSKMIGVQHEGCYICNGKNHYKTKESLQKEVNEKFPNTYKIIGDYVRAREPIKITNIKCGHSYSITPDNLLRGKGCPLCHQSSFENYVDKYLNENYPTYVKQKHYDDCKGVGGRVLSFDYYIPEYNTCIEIDGQFHYFFSCYLSNEMIQKSHINTVQNDKIKDEYCKAHDIPLIRIKYNQLDNIDSILKESLCQFRDNSFDLKGE